jgi:hypothetical protein
MVLSSNHRHIWNKELKAVYHWYSLPNLPYLTMFAAQYASTY